MAYTLLYVPPQNCEAILIGLGELTHIVAGSVEVLYAVTSGAVSWGQYFGGFMIPTLLGNIVGDVSLVAALNYAQVAPTVNRNL